MFSLGQASFMAIGAYGAGVLAVSWGIPFPIAAGAGIVLSSVTAFLVGLPTIRLRRDYIALVTFGFGEAIIAILNNTVQITGGAMGLMGIPMLTTFPLAFGSAVVVVALAWNFKRSRFGRQCLALKTDELAARSMGIDVDRLKMTAFVFSAAVPGTPGSFTHFTPATSSRTTLTGTSRRSGSSWFFSAGSVASPAPSFPPLYWAPCPRYSASLPSGVLSLTA